MRLPSVPGPSDVLAAVSGVREGIGDALAPVPRLGLVVGRIEQLLDRVDGVVDRVDGLVDRAETLHPDEVTALITIIDRVPRLLGHLDDDVLPVLESLDSVGTDVRDLLDTVQDLRQVVKGFPGSRLFRRRGAEEIAQDEARERAEELAEGQFSQT